jgi:hypothetical protein
MAPSRRVSPAHWEIIRGRDHARLMGRWVTASSRNRKVAPTNLVSSTCLVDAVMVRLAGFAVLLFCDVPEGSRENGEPASHGSRSYARRNQ